MFTQQPSGIRYSSLKERCDSTNAKSQYAEKQLGTPDAVAAGRIAVIDGLTGLARQLAAVAKEFFSPAMSIQSGERVERERQSAFAISAALLDVAEAQTVPLLSSLPAFTVPARKVRPSGGGCSLSLTFSDQDDNDPALAAARTAVVETVDSLKAFIADGKQFAADSAAAQFLSAFLKEPPTADEQVEDAVEKAFRATK
jgi:hypothetical protein